MAHTQVWQRKNGKKIKRKKKTLKSVVNGVKGREGETGGMDNYMKCCWDKYRRAEGDCERRCSSDAMNSKWGESPGSCGAGAHSSVPGLHFLGIRALLGK